MAFLPYKLLESFPISPSTWPTGHLVTTYAPPVFCPFLLRSVTDEQHVRIIVWFTRPSPLSHFVKDLYSKYNTSTIPNLHKYNILLFVHKFFHHPYQLPDIFVSYFTINSEYHGYCTRSKGDPHLELFTSSLGQRSLKYKEPRLWCSLSDQLKTISSTHSFKHKLKIYLQNQQDVWHYQPRCYFFKVYTLLK